MSQQRLDSIEEIFNVLDKRDESTALTLIEDLDQETILKKHKDGRTLLHKAVDVLSPRLIDALIQKKRELLFTYNANGLSPLSCALKKYTESRSVISKSVINQIYFSLSRGIERNRLVNDRANIYGTWAVFHDRVWQHGLELCFRRDSNGTIVSIDMDWLDFVLQVVNDGLYVDYGLLGGATVNRSIMAWWVKHEYSDAYGMFNQALGQQKDGLAQRTITQLTANASLAKSKDMQGRVQLNLPYLISVEMNPTTNNVPYNEALISFKGNLYYKDGSSIQMIDSSDFDADQLKSFEKLKTLFSSVRIRILTLEEARDAWTIKPLMQQVSKSSGAPIEVSLRTIRANSSIFASSNSSSLDDEKSNILGANHAK